ncbi:glycoside hydrolase family 5 protein [Geranomyces variabilis]|nr:glycoside hydrolase family 5 protein [Geranomyces variabilis]KAJ3142721.1 hypothetical protein HDU90_002592 [Geranomyces variabilis]
MSTLRLTIEDGRFCDRFGRHHLLRGINVAGDAKLPSEPNIASHDPNDFFDGDNVSFHNRPFRREDAHILFSRLRRSGYNTIRYVFTWEAIEAAGPGIYDEVWIQHTIELLRRAKEYGFYVFMDPHQDVWVSLLRRLRRTDVDDLRMRAGRHGLCGYRKLRLCTTPTAATSSSFPAMIWTTNYQRLAAATIFTMFFAGRDFAPKCIIDGLNIQDYLQAHFLGACAHLAMRIHEAGDIENDAVFGWESLNEPDRGLIGHVDLGVVPRDQNLKKGTCPTMWEAILTGSGRACEIDSWDMGRRGAYRTGRSLIDPRGVMAWLPAGHDDSRYGWKRHPGWKLGECVWAQHGVWDSTNDTLLQNNYFQKHPITGVVLDYETFTNTYWLDFYRRFRNTIRSIHKDALLLCQPPVLEIPPKIKGTPHDDPRMVYAPHFYDGFTLMTKKWNSSWNVDVFGILRKRYLHPALAVQIGEKAIRNSFKKQLEAFGIPYDMDDRRAYRTGDYTSQAAAMDANHSAVRGALMDGYTLWVYVASNDHSRGDQWNREGLSIVSTDDGDQTAAAPGARAAEAYIRPAPTCVNGSLSRYGFDLKNRAFEMELKAPPLDTKLVAPTVVFLPECHFPTNGHCTVEVSSGKWEIKLVDNDDQPAAARTKELRWWHGRGQQSIKVTGRKG